MEGGTSIYHPLDASLRYIRLARILPTEDALSHVQCTLEVHSLNETSQFEALSYCWGDPKVTADIELNGTKLAVTTNLEAALRQFRASAGATAIVIWIDAICINQQDVEERNSQVTLMQQIYSKASNVRIWLGQASWDTEQVFRVLRRILYEPTTSNSLESLSSEEHSVEERMIFLAIVFSYPYWERRWIVQEVRSAQFRTLHIGNSVEKLPADVFAKLREYVRVQIIVALYQAACTKRDASIEVGPDGIPVSSTIEQAALVLGHMLEHTQTVLADLSNKQQWHNFLRALKTSKCSVEHDTIYAILGLLPDKLGMQIDYKIPIVDLLCEFTYRWIQHHQTLNVFYDVRNVDPDLPSWVPELRCSRLEHSPLGPYALGPDAITPDTICAGKFKAHAGGIKSEMKRIDHYTISVGTFLFDTVVAVSPNHGPHNISVLHGLTMHDAVEQHLPADWSALYRKHCASTYLNQDPHEVILKTFYLNQDRHVGPRDPKAHKGAYLGGSGKFSALFKLVNKSTNGGPFFTFYVTAKGRCGVCISDIAVGDRIGIIARLWMPFVLRETARKRDGMEGYLLVSSCYLHGVMDGEAVLEAVGEDESRVNEVFEQIGIV